MLAFVDEQEILDFRTHCAATGKSPQGVAGVACEWEGEDVLHFHQKRPLHGYGKESPCLFTDDCAALEDPVCIEKYSYIVVVTEKTVAAFAQYPKDSAERKECVWQNIDLQYIPSRENLYSRSQGILEVGALAAKRVAIVGLGSFGSQIAIELAKAGIGEFSLLDFDRVELHNLMRHTCGINDLGRLKTDALYDAILGKNPYAKVDKFPVDINQNLKLLDQEVSRADLVICATDNNKSRFNLNEAVVRNRKVCLYGRANTRAAGGDVFRYVPDGPCYNCLLGNAWYDAETEEITNVESARHNGQIAAYVSAEDAAAKVQVGLSADIAPICNMMVKIALVELSRGIDSGISSLEHELVYDYYMWANRRENRFENWSAMPGAGAKPTILRWYGCRIQKLEGCAQCSKSGFAELDEGDDVEELLEKISSC